MKLEDIGKSGSLTLLHKHCFPALFPVDVNKLGNIVFESIANYCQSVVFDGHCRPRHAVIPNGR